jgi:serine/threonine-protein kinase
MPLFFLCQQGHQWEVDVAHLAPGESHTTRCGVCGELAIRVLTAKIDLPETTPPTTAPAIEPPQQVNKPPLPVDTRRAKPLRPGARGELTIPGYTIIGELGRGGMGVVYKATQTGTNRTVAIKMVLSGVHASDREVVRFRAEAEAVQRLRHPNIVELYEVGNLDGQPYFVLEYVDGGSLAEIIAGRPQPQEKAALLVEKLARAMHIAHGAAVIHRDLKPANVLVTVDGTPKIADFGLAKQLDHSTQLTSTGAIMGTPNYMAPEQAEGRSKEIGPLTDVYALGTILYELLTGRPPFQGANLVETLDQVRSNKPLPPHRFQPYLAHDVERICLKCLEKTPQLRYHSALELADDLARFLRGDQVEAKKDGGVLEEYLAEQHRKQLEMNRRWHRQKREQEELERQAKRFWKNVLIVLFVVVASFGLFVSCHALGLFSSR